MNNYKQCAICYNYFNWRERPGKGASSRTLCEDCEAIPGRGSILSTCQNCSKLFRKFASSARNNCSNACGRESQLRTRHNRIPVVQCTYCGKEFKTALFKIKKGRKFCSHDCSVKETMRRAVTEERYCRWCNKCCTGKNHGYIKKLCNACYQQWNTHYGKAARSKWRTGYCPVCGDMYVTTTNKKFCSHRCYLQSDVFWNARQAYAEKMESRRIAMECLYCGKKLKVMPSLAMEQTYGRKNRSKKKFCNRLCHRKYFDERFDRFVAADNLIGKPINYDEFLSQEELPCLVDGCDWIGHNLAIHANHVHGITAEKLKEMAGFNRTTGLISATAYKNLMESQSARSDGFIDGNASFLETDHDLAMERGRHTFVMREEGKQHLRKAMAAYYASKK